LNAFVPVERRSKETRGTTVKVLLVDDSPAVQRSFTPLLQSAPGVVVVGYAEDVASAVAVIDAVSPDLIVLDVQLRNDDRGLNVLRHVSHHRPEIKVVVVCQFDAEDLYRRGRACLLRQGHRISARARLRR
jgi:two-component system response regulator DevR